MVLSEFITAPNVTALILIALSAVQIAPIKINPWSWVGGLVGKAIGIENLSKRIDKIDLDITDIKTELQEVDRRNAKTRTRVVRKEIVNFAQQLRLGVEMSNAQFEEVGRMIDEYNKVTDRYEIENSFCESEIEYIMERSKERRILK